MSKKLKQTVCAIAWKDKDGNTQLTFHAGREKTVEEIQTHAMNTIPEKYKDREFITIQEIPETFLRWYLFCLSAVRNLFTLLIGIKTR